VTAAAAFRPASPFSPKPGEIVVRKRFPPLTRQALALYAGASGDHNPIHIDSDFARSAGFPDVFAQGMLAMAYLGQALTDAVPPAAIRRFSTRFAAITLLGEELTCEGELADLGQGTEDGTTARIALVARNAAGDVKLTGEALVDMDVWEAARAQA
jgi:acyl dehydratase